MKDSIALQMALDWADDKHDFAYACAGSPDRQTGVIAHEPKVLHEWLRRLRQQYPWGRFEVIVELKKGPLIEVLRAYDFIDIYPIPTTSASYFRRSLFPSLSKNDLLDTSILLDLLEGHKDRLRPLIQSDPQIVLLDGLNQMRRDLVEQRVKAVQKLQNVLKGYYPQALKLAGDLTRPMAARFLKRWPTWQSLDQTRPQTLKNFYHQNDSRSQQLIQERLRLLQQSQALTNDPVSLELGELKALNLIEQIKNLNTHIQELEKRIHEVYQAHPQKPLIDSLPRAGKALAPRLLAAMAEHMKTCQSAKELATLTAVAPLKIQSNKRWIVTARYFKPKFLHQTFVEYAEQSRLKSKWAKAYYQYHKDVLKKTHRAILRSLAYKWIRILFRCFQQNDPYDEKKYIKTLKRKNVPYL